MTTRPRRDSTSSLAAAIQVNVYFYLFENPT
jgi:hypothetical protein